MKKTFSLKKVAAAVALLAGAQTAHALTPWVDGAPDIIIYTSGGAAQDRAIDLAVASALAEPGTLDWFSDLSTSTGSIGGRWRTYYFRGKSTLGQGLAGQKIAFEKRSYGAAGYGVIPLLANNGAGLPLEHLNIVGTTAAQWQSDGASGGATRWIAAINAGNANTYLTKVTSDGGFLGVDPEILLKPFTENYPEQVNEFTTGLPEPHWPNNLKSVPRTGANGFTVVPTGGLVYGIGFTEDLYRVLQAAQKRAGKLPEDVVIGHYDDRSLPSLNRDFLGSLVAGKIKAWDQVKIIDKNSGNVLSLTDPDILAEAGVPEPYKEQGTGESLTPVAIGRRNRGAAIGAVGYAKLLHYPGLPNANAPEPTTPDDEFDEEFTLPIAKSPGGVRGSIDLLKDWQLGTNTTGWNNVPDGSGFAKRWGFALLSGDRNAGVNANGVGGEPWRYIKIDGAAPTLRNVASGAYPYWAEGVVLYRTNKPSDSQWSLKARVLKAFADDLGSPTVAAASNANANLAFGRSGIFATTRDPRGFTTSIPFDDNNPVIPLTHNNKGVTSLEIVPVVDGNAAGGFVDVELR
ncbi:MAG: hypothetical protein CVV06_00395 [Gammaproteobacteria bacterium HGW-Gammaproteobacteria-10]|nr:MAG: hypothetical protein CVV06_00395 [Gammaproteobacteria bacterium HGW-Gammaproteobacteria-10]